MKNIHPDSECQVCGRPMSLVNVETSKYHCLRCMPDGEIPFVMPVELSAAPVKPGAITDPIGYMRKLGFECIEADAAVGYFLMSCPLFDDTHDRGDVLAMIEPVGVGTGASALFFVTFETNAVLGHDNATAEIAKLSIIDVPMDILDVRKMARILVTLRHLHDQASALEIL